MKTRIDPFTGLEIPVFDFADQTEYMICKNEIPEGHAAMGVGIAVATFDKKSKALRYQLANGLTNSTHIIEVTF